MTAPARPAIESVLVYVGFDRVGDGLLKLPFVRGLRSAFPEASITWLAGQDTSVYAGVMAAAVEGHLDEVVERAGVGVAPMEILTGHGRGALAGRRFDLVIDTQRIFWVSLSVRRIAHRTFVSPAARFLLSGEKPPPGYRNPETMQRQLLDLLEIASARSFPTPDTLDLAIDGALRAEAERLLPQGPDYVGLAPGSGGPPKCWPLGRFIDIAKAEMQAGRVPVFVLGPKEDNWAGEIRSAVPGAVLPLQDERTRARFGPSPFLTVALAGRLRAAVSNDSGAAHLLAVGGAPLVILYGPTRPGKFRPMSRDVTDVFAADFGGREMAAIPLNAVSQALAAKLGA